MAADPGLPPLWVVSRPSLRVLAHIADYLVRPVHELLWNMAEIRVIAWISGKRPVEPGYDSAMFRRLRDFAEAGGQ